MMAISSTQIPTLAPGILRSIHHIALNVVNMSASRDFYGRILGLHELLGAEIPSTLIELVKQGRVANFRTPDGTILDLFAEPELSPPSPDPTHQFTRANSLAPIISPSISLLICSISPSQFYTPMVSKLTVNPLSDRQVEASTVTIPMASSSKFAAIQRMRADVEYLE
jgi:Glyoxalase/Bleomycin resistance protein/Dioxygenase superfamily